jgi:hypothetical protein
MADGSRFIGHEPGPMAHRSRSIEHQELPMVDEPRLLVDRSRSMGACQKVCALAVSRVATFSRSGPKKIMSWLKIRSQ